MSRLNDGTPCARCGRPAAGFATIGDERYCHGDDERPTCYMRASWELSAQPRDTDDAVLASLRRMLRLTLDAG